MVERRLIDADTLLETIHDTADGLADCDQQNAAWALRKYAARDIMDATTVDAVEVVRCKDCKWFDPIKRECCGNIVTDNEDGADFTINFEENDFCSYGERRPE